MHNAITNFVLFQIGWFACVLGGAYHYPLLGSMIAVAIISYHLFSAKEWHLELVLIGIAMVLGFVWDSYLTYMGWIAYPNGQISLDTAPYWIVVMWGLFTTTLNVSLKWLKSRLVYSALFGAIGGPLAYYAGENLGALEFVAPTNALFALSIGWAVFTPLLLRLTHYLNGFGAIEQRSTS